MPLPISVAIPVGPDPHYLEWLDECVDSVIANDPKQIIIIDDMQWLGADWIGTLYKKFPNTMYIRNKWLCGCSTSWNFAVAEASEELVFLCGSDDVMLEGCLEAIYKSYLEHDSMYGFYSVTIQYDNGELQDLPCNAAAVCKKLWAEIGGFEPAAFAAPDGFLLSIMLTYMNNRIIQVDKGTPRYKVRSHLYQDTARQFGRFFEPAHQLRDIGTRTWKKPEWTAKLGW